jgi:hypothetical protein
MTEPEPFTDLGLAPFGSPRCAHCGNPTGLRKFRHEDGSTHVLHLACAKPFFAAMEAPRVAGEKIDQDQAEEPASTTEPRSP